MKVWITKYALTQGIFEIEGEYWQNLEKLDMDVISPTNQPGLYFGKDKEWSLIKEEAIITSNKMRLKKIESLKKQITKLENMRFE